MSLWLLLIAWSGSSSAGILDDYGKLPLAFEQNVGQTAIVTAAVGADLHTILLPMHTTVPVSGVLESRWMTNLTVYNASQHQILLVPCGIPNRCPPAVFLFNPRVTERNPGVGFTDAGRNGRLLYLRSEDAPHVFLRLTAVAVGNSSEVEIPVVHEQNFRTSLVELLDVPVADTSRTLLRIYDIDDRDASTVLIRIFDANDLAVFEQLFTFNQSGYGHPEGSPFAPGFLSVSLEPLHLQSQKVRIEIEPVTPGLRFWAFVTVTDNLTSAVRVFSPQ